MPMAPGPPAMFVFLNDHVRDGLDWCCSSIFLCQRFYCCDLECQEAVNLWSTPSYWKSHDLPFTHKVQYFFFADCPSLIYILVSLWHILWGCVCPIGTLFILYTSLIPLGGNSSAVFDPSYIFISSGHPQCSTRRPTAGLKPTLWSRGLRMAQRWYICIVFTFLFI